MIESIFVIGKVLGILFLVCKSISLAGQISDTGEIRNLMGASLSLRAGNFGTKR